jgi:hypothetical protein
VNLSTQYSQNLRTLFSITRTELILPTTSSDQKSSWTGLSLNGNYSVLNNALNISSGISFFDVGTTKLYGLNLGSVYKIRNLVDIGLSGNIQLNHSPEGDEEWIWNSTSLILTAGYKF